MANFIVVLWLYPDRPGHRHSECGDIAEPVVAASLDAAIKAVMEQHQVVYADTVFAGNLDTDRGAWRFGVWSTGEFASAC